MTSPVRTRHKDHAHGRNAGDEHTIMPGSAWQPGAAQAGRGSCLFDSVLDELGAAGGQGLAKRRDTQTQTAMPRFTFRLLPEQLLEVIQRSRIGAACFE